MLTFCPSQHGPQGMTTNESNDFGLQGDEGFPTLDQTWIWGLDNLLSNG